MASIVWRPHAYNRLSSPHPLVDNSELVGFTRISGWSLERIRGSVARIGDANVIVWRPLMTPCTGWCYWRHVIASSDVMSWLVEHVHSCISASVGHHSASHALDTGHRSDSVMPPTYFETNHSRFIVATCWTVTFTETQTGRFFPPAETRVDHSKLSDYLCFYRSSAWSHN